MREFIVLGILAMASADNFSYNYQPVAYPNDAILYSPHQMNAALFDQSLDVPLQQDTAQQSNPITAQYDKEFYSFSAPEESFDVPEENERIASTLKKNLRVVFIRTPENKGLEDAAFNLIKQSSEDHTAIYVLAKQTDIGNLAQQLQTVKSESQSKPEVHFVKYRTPEDALHAQRAIQDQYNSELPGNSRTVKEGQATVLSFASKSAPAPATVAPTVTPTKGYLSQTLRRRFRL